MRQEFHVNSHHMNRSDIELWAGPYSRLIGPDTREALNYTIIQEHTKKVTREIKCEHELGNFIGGGLC